MLINVIPLVLVTIGLQLNLIVTTPFTESSSTSSTFNQQQSNVQLLQPNENEINLINGLSSDWNSDSNDAENSVNYTTSWFIGDNLRCKIKLSTNYESLSDDSNQTNSIDKLIVWYQIKGSKGYQLWMDSNEKSSHLFPKEYTIDLPLIRKNQFRLLIGFQSSKPFNKEPQLINTLEIDRCWYTYQACPVLSCLSNGSHNGIFCTYTPTLSFNCSTIGLCIHQDEVCDYEINCPDGSDEANCDLPSQLSINASTNNIFNSDDNDLIVIPVDSNQGNNNKPKSIRCSFESDYCLWKPIILKSNSDSCFWGNCSHEQGLTRTKAKDSLDNGPTFDHTLGSTEGHYLLLKASSERGKTIGSIVSSSLIGGHCKLVFYYKTNSRYGQVLVRSSENLTSLNPFSTIEVVDLDCENSLFTRAEVEIDLNSKGEWLFLMTTVKGSENAYLAIDDIYFTTGCLPVFNSTTSVHTPIIETMTSNNNITLPSIITEMTTSNSSSSSSSTHHTN